MTGLNINAFGCEHYAFLVDISFHSIILLDSCLVVECVFYVCVLRVRILTKYLPPHLVQTNRYFMLTVIVLDTFYYDLDSIRLIEFPKFDAES